MAFEPTDWVDGEAGGTPITAAELNRIEDGIVAADVVTWAEITGKPTTFAPIVGTTVTTAAAGNDSRIVAAVPNTRTVNAKALSANVVLTGADVVATGYVIGTTALAAVAATDTLIAAIGKLEKRIVDLEAV